MEVFESAGSFGLAALVLGLSAGLAPGPMTALVLSQTLGHGPKEGLKVALVPVVTDGPLLILSATAMGALSGMSTLLDIIALLGAGFLLMLAWETWHATLPPSPEQAGPANSIRKAILTNLLNPHPYVFWLTIGGPMTHRAYTHGWLATGLFLAGFFGGLCGSKAAFAISLALIRHKIDARIYQWIMRGLAVLLAGFALGFLSSIEALTKA